MSNETIRCGFATGQVDPRDKPEDDGLVWPMEFAIEAQKLIGISLEGSVG